ncbi:MAG: hypothetical protein ABI861_04435, partial [Panacibacter sp.]
LLKVIQLCAAKILSGIYLPDYACSGEAITSKLMAYSPLLHSCISLHCSTKQLHISYFTMFSCTHILLAVLQSFGFSRSYKFYKNPYNENFLSGSWFSRFSATSGAGVNYRLYCLI